MKYINKMKIKSSEDVTNNQRDSERDNMTGALLAVPVREHLNFILVGNVLNIISHTVKLCQGLSPRI